MKKTNKAPWDILSERNNTLLLGENVSLEPLEDILRYIEPELLMVFAYILMISIRSFLQEHETYVDSVLCISGDHGWGENEFAAWAGGIYTQDKEALGIVPKGSTYKEIAKKLRSLKNQPLVVDDHRLKGSKYKRQKVTWELFKEGIDPCCRAGLILLTDIVPYDCCILVPDPEFLDIPKAFTPELLGASVRHFLHWMSEHHKAFHKKFMQRFDEAQVLSFTEGLTYCPYAYLDLVLKCFLASLGLPKEMQKAICQKMQKASERSCELQLEVKEEILEEESHGHE